MRTAVILSLALALPVRADALSDLRAALDRLPGTTSTKANLTLQTWNRSTEDKKPKDTQGSAYAWVEDGPEGLRLLWSRDLLRKVESEDQAHKADPEKDTPTRAAFGKVDALDVADLLNYAKSFQRELADAELVGQQAEAFEGKPATRLDLKLQPKLSESDRKHIKKLEATAKVWLGADGLPIGLELFQSMKGSFFLISFQGEHKKRLAFLHAGDRLIAIKRESEEKGSGMGMGSESRTVITIKPN